LIYKRLVDHFLNKKDGKYYCPECNQEIPPEKLDEVEKNLESLLP